MPSKRCNRRQVTMLKSQGISLAPQKTSCAVNSSLIARATKDKSDAQSGSPGNARKRYSSGFASVGSRGSETLTARM